MKHYVQAFVWYATVVLLAAGCATEREIPIGEGPPTAQESQWLAKAYRQDVNGWIYLHIEGAPFERGFQRGYLTADENAELLKALAYTQKFETAKDLDFFVDEAATLFKGKVSSEYVEEMKGMVAGMRRRGKKITYDQMLFMNGFIDVCWYWWPKEKDSMGPGCSAFIATGEVTADGKIVMAHNSWDDYAVGAYANVIVDIVPDKGHRILMQSWGPLIYSGSDFFITSAGLIGTETTIGGFKGFDSKGTPVFERARRAMQYANTIDEWAQILIEHNSGAYANSWLLGDIKTNEIARLELGLKHHSLEKKQSGYFSGSNVTNDIALLRDEAELGYDDIRISPVARRERWKQLMRTYNGKVDVDLARQMLADHYDMYEGREKPGLRTICGHGESDDGRIPDSGAPWGAYSPAGALDGKVVDASMAARWQFWAKWGSSCDRDFRANDFLEKHTQYDWLKGYLKDLPPEPWTVFPMERGPSTPGQSR